MHKLFLARLVAAFLILGLLASCQEPPAGEPFWGSFGSGEPRILVTQILANGESISMYSMTGELISVVRDFSNENLDPDGVLPIDGLNFFVVLDGIDQFVIMNIFGEIVEAFSTTFFSGNLYQMTQARGDLFFTESNVVESFTMNGSRIGNPRVPTNVGGCTIAAARSVAETVDGYLAVVGTGNDDLNIYDISDPAATQCIVANQTLGNVNPVAVISHSDGFLYVATQGDDAVYRFSGDGSGAGTVIFNPGTGILNNPTSLLEMPDGSLLVASDGTNNIIRISTDGTLLDNPFIKTAFTGQVGQMAILGGAQ